MSKSVDLDRLEAAIKDLESRMRSLKFAMDHNEAEIKHLYAIEILLEENITELKRDYIIAVAHEYRKAKEDLTKVRLRLGFLELDRGLYQKAYQGHNGMLQMLQRKLIEITEKLNNNLIHVKFGRKNGG